MSGLCLLMAAFFPLLATADNPVMLGEREGFTADTGIARLGSSAAGYYNPAGLAAVEQSKISASGTLFQQVFPKISGPISTSEQSFQSIPTQVSTVRKFGRLRAAFSIFNTHNSDDKMALDINLGTGAPSMPMRVTAQESTLLFGPSLALPILQDLFLGFSAFVRKDDSYLNMVIRADSSSGVQQLHELMQLEVQNSTFTFVPILGLTWLVSPDFVLGARLSPPSLPLFGGAQVTTQTVGYTVDNSGNFTDQGIPAATVNHRSTTLAPAEIGLGGAWTLSHRLQLFADAANSFARNYRQYNGALTDSDLANSHSFSAGVEWTPSPTSIWAAGALYKEEPLRHLSGTIPAYKAITMGYTMLGEHFDSGVGLSYLFGSSRGLESHSFTAIGLLLTSSYKF
jgi:hypothetical protein